MKLTALLFTASLSLASTPLWAQAPSPGDGLAPKVGAEHPAAELADGVVKRLNAAAGKVTLTHGRIPSLDMPPMTMVFTLEDPAMLDKLTVGGRVRFDAKLDNGRFVVTHIEPAK